MERRTNRDQESRNMDLRKAKLNPVMNMRAHNALHIPREIIPDDKEYLWGRISIRGEPDITRESDLAYQGWTPVPASRHPELVAKDFLKRLEHLSQYIFRSGLILFEIEKEIYQQMQNQYIRETYELTNNLAGLSEVLDETGNIKTRAEFYDYTLEENRGRKRNESRW